MLTTDSAEGDLGGSDAGGRTKIKWATAIDGDMKQRLLKQHEEDYEFDDFGGDYREVNISWPIDDRSRGENVEK